MNRFSEKTWVHSARVGTKGSFVGQVVDVLKDNEYIIRDADRRKWLRKGAELSLVE